MPDAMMPPPPPPADDTRSWFARRTTAEKVMGGVLIGVLGLLVLVPLVWVIVDQQRTYGPTAEATASPTIDEPTEDVAEAETSTSVDPAAPISLSPAEVSVLESGMDESVAPVMDDRLLPAIEAGMNAVAANGGTADGLDLSGVFADQNTLSQIEEIVAKPEVSNPDNTSTRVCPMIDAASVIGCGLNFSSFALGENSLIVVGYSYGNSSQDEGSISIQTAAQPVIRDGTLVLATDGEGIGVTYP